MTIGERENLEISSACILHLPSNSSLICLFFVMFLLQSSIRFPCKSKEMLPLRNQNCKDSACVTVALSNRIIATSMIVSHFILCVDSSKFHHNLNSYMLIPLCVRSCLCDTAIKNTSHCLNPGSCCGDVGFPCTSLFSLATCVSLSPSWFQSL